MFTTKPLGQEKLTGNLVTLAVCLVFFTNLVTFAFSGEDAKKDNYNWQIEFNKDNQVYAVDEEVIVRADLYLGDNKVTDGKFSFTIVGDNSVKSSGTGEFTPESGYVLQTKLSRPGFVRCNLSYEAPDKQKINGNFGFAVDPTAIKPGRIRPADFNQYWDKIKTELANLPYKVEIKAVPLTVEQEKNYGGKVNVYDVCINTLGNMPFIYGYLCVPTTATDKSLPIYMSYQGAGFRDSGKLIYQASLGRLAMDISAHGFPNGYSTEFYNQLGNSNADYRTRGANSRDTIYFRHMFIRAYRALQWLKTRPEWDGKIIVVTGGSQGGGQALAVTGLDPQVTFCFAGVPALCDHGGETAEREAGWPKIQQQQKNAKIESACDYIDAAFFAENIVDTECLLSVGFFDPVCVPSSVYAAYNAIASDKKQIIHDLNSNHTITKSTNLQRDVTITKHIAEYQSGD